MPVMRRGGVCGGLGFPNAANTGPAAGGYTSLTPVTGASFSIEWNHPTLWPSWVQTLTEPAYGLPAGAQYVVGQAFGPGTSMFVTVPDIAFIGCSILGAIGTTAGINFVSAATTVAAGSAGGEISQIATWGGAYGGNGVLCVAAGSFAPAGGGTVVVATSTTPATITYAAVSGNTLTGCVYVSGSATGTVSTGGAVTLQSGQMTVQYCTISAQDAVPADRLHICIDGDSCIGTIVIDHCNFYWWEQAVHVAATTLITSSYIHDPVFFAGDHTEALFMNAGSALDVANCTLLNSLSQTAVLAAGTAPTSFSATGCLLGGGGYCFYSYTAASDIVIAGNWFTTGYWPGSGQFGLVNSAPAWGSNGNTWAGNRWYDGPDAGQVITAP